MQTYDMEERLLAQMLFTGSCAQMDSVFELYMKRKQTRKAWSRLILPRNASSISWKEKKSTRRFLDI